MDGEWAVKEREERRKGGIEKGDREEGKLGRKGGSNNEVNQPRASNFG